jgi:hypothetical protein
MRRIALLLEAGKALAVMWVEKMRVYFHVRGVAS